MIEATVQDGSGMDSDSGRKDNDNGTVNYELCRLYGGIQYTVYNTRNSFFRYIYDFKTIILEGQNEMDEIMWIG